MLNKGKIELLKGNAIELLGKLPPKSVNLIFADPPYNLSGKNHLTCKNGKVAVCNKGEWDEIKDIHKFNKQWLEACIRVLRDDGTIWISGTLHNHPSVGVILKELGLWIINDIIWYKPNAAPLLQGNRLAPSTELIWLASKSKNYFFNYERARQINNGKQMRNLWTISATRHLTTHPTEKPENLLQRIILIGSKESDIILDPFMGSGTTGVVAKRFGRNFIGIEIDSLYFEMATHRIENTVREPDLFITPQSLSGNSVRHHQHSLLQIITKGLKRD
ncbi:MAG TPA: site-specific DNA-methyltransferase [Sedimentisphaerales bacterium]|nr:site-specific DNA-methyltransferase [Sedimentisphaerales bacterium]